MKEQASSLLHAFMRQQVQKDAFFPDPNMNYGSGSPLPPSCTCGCSGCIWDDGGTGFSLGMNMNKIG